MVIRFKAADIRCMDLQRAVYRAYVTCIGTDGEYVNGKFYTPFDVKNGIYLKPNMDLYIDPSMPSMIYGEFLKVLRASNFLTEEGKIIER